MDNMTALHPATSVDCRCSRRDRDRLVPSSLSPRLARILRQVIASSR